MLKWFMAALWIASAALGQTTRTVALLAGFEGAPANWAYEAMQTELSTLYAPAGVGLEWYPLETASHLGRPDAVIVVRFTGACHWPWGRSARAVVGTLAWTPQIDGQIQPWITVDCDRIAAFTGAPNQALLGRALARVVAHELYHYLTQQAAHTQTVLNRLAVDPQDLLDQDAAFEPAELEALQAALSGAAARPVKLKAS